MDGDDFWYVLERARHHSANQGATARTLDGVVVGIYFRRTSTRTRTAFSVGAQRLGAGIVQYGPHDLQENTGEIVDDTARVFSHMLDALVVRTAGNPVELRILADQPRMAVINAMSADEHPTQAFADLSTILSQRGELSGVRILYVGEGNNTATALALAVARLPGAALYLRTPPGYGIPEDKRALAKSMAASTGAVIDECHDATALPEDVDFVYTTRWQTTGTTKSDPDWRTTFTPFRVDSQLIERYPGCRFMHDLPAHRGEEVDADVLDGPDSIAFEQATHKLYSAMAVLEWCVLGRV
jgi:ornithine carbamoyltransferase